MKPERLIIPFVLLAFVTMAQVHAGVSAHGLSAVALVPPLLGFALISAILYGVYRWARRAAEAESIPPQRLGFFLAVGVVGFALSAAAGLMSKSIDKPSPDKGLSPAFRGEGVRLSSAPLGMALTVPPGWTRKVITPQPGADFALVHAGGAAFVGYGLTAEAGASLDGTLQTMLAQRAGAEDVVWGEEPLANERARTLLFSTSVQGGRARTKIWLARRGPYLVGFTCSGGEAVFTEIQSRCRALLDTLEAR